ncbi:transposase [Granulicella aggregans]|uniref:Transposase n=1 Tax=Granulicella aggregans TaxID=474949 RepID=A0A7W7ZIA0_9BACT|nr:transposase [Granulicella aggregans]MBB5060253.1 transposase [Granulicella aggregans]
MSKKRFELLSERQWELIAPLLPEPKQRKDRRGRPWASNRACLEGILWVLQTGAAWRFLPDKYPSPATCWRRLKQWEEQDVWLDAWRALLGALDGEGLLKWEETFLDGSFAPAKKGAPQSVKPSAARARSGWYWSTVAVFRWEFGCKVPLREKLRLRKPRSPKSKSLAPKAGRGRSRNG